MIYTSTGPGKDKAILPEEGEGGGAGCKGCAYAILLSRTWYCDYLGVTGHRRPCPPGGGCTVRAGGDQDPKRTWKETAPIRGRGWNTGRARALYEEGCTDREIAAELGIRETTVSFWRRTQDLPSNRERRDAQGGNG